MTTVWVRSFTATPNGPEWLVPLQVAPLITDIVCPLNDVPELGA